MADRYWVGGTSNWNSTANWSTSSGGSGGASVPGSSDHAIFDSNSGTGTCTVDVTTTVQRLSTPGYGGTLDFSTYGMTVGSCEFYNGTINGGSGTLEVTGNFVTTFCTFNGQTGTLLWSGSGSSTWRHQDNGHNFNDVTINGTGTLTFEDDGGTNTIDIDGDLRVTGGTFKTKDPDEGDADFDIEGDLIINGGTLDCSNSSSLFEVAGDVTFTSGTFTAGSSKIKCDGTTTQTLTADEASFTLFDLQISNGAADVDLGSDIRTTGVLTIDLYCRLDTVATYDVYLRQATAGTALVLNGLIYGNGSTLHYEINAAGTHYICGSTGWNIDGGLTGMALHVEIINNVTATVRMSADIRDVNNFGIWSTAAGSSAVITFYTDNYHIRKTDGTGEGVYAHIRIGPELAADACTFTSYWGSSSIRWSSFIRWQWDAATHNLQSASFKAKDGPENTTWSVYGITTNAVNTAQTFNEGTSLVQCRNFGESWQARSAGPGHPVEYDLYDVIVDYTGGTGYIYTSLQANNKLSTLDNGSSSETSVECHCEFYAAELELTADYADVVFDFYEDDTYVATVDDFDFRGTGTNRVRIRSRVDTDAARVNVTNNGTVTRTDVKDNNLSGGYIDATDTTNVDSGNNSNHWVFVLATVGGDRYAPAGVERGVLVGTA